MSKESKKKKGRLFNNPVLESLTRTNPVIIYSMYIPFSAYLLYYFYINIESSLIILSSVFLAGVFSWTLYEYLMHRYAFHFITDSPVIKRIHFLIHGVHHAYPKDTERLIMPPLPSVIVATILFLLFKLIMGSYVFAFLPGFVIGYLIYARIHYLIHSTKPSKGFEYLWKHHIIHHYKQPDRAFGVSSPLWDMVFGTMPKKND